MNTGKSTKKILLPLYPIALCIAIILGCSTPLKSQDTLNSLVVEQKSYQLYLDKKWNELISFGNKSIKQGYDYYYLDMRMGIAYYEKKNFYYAEPFFNKAIDLNRGDELALEYLYYCYIFTARFDEARVLSNSFSKTLAAKTGTDNLSDVGYIMLEAGTKVPNSGSFTQSVSGPYEKGKDVTLYPTQNTNSINPALYAQFGLNHYIKNRVSVFHALTYFNQTTAQDSSLQFEQLVKWKVVHPMIDSTIVAIPAKTDVKSSYNYNLQQIQYYLKANVPLHNNWSVSSAIHWINTKFTYSGDCVSGRPVLSSPPPQPFPGTVVIPQTNPSPPPNFTIPQTLVSSNYFVGSIAVQKTFKKLTTSVGSTFSNMSGINQIINNGLVAYSPFGNNNLIVGCTGYLHSTDNYKTSYLSALPFLYFQPHKKAGIRLGYFTNAGHNIIEDNGYQVNNSPDLTQSRISVLGNFYANKTLTLYATYLFENKFSNTQKFSYQYHIFVVGIKIVPKK